MAHQKKADKEYVKMPGKPDAKYMENMRESIKVRKESEARAASRAPKAEPAKREIKPLTERIVFGMGSRKKMMK